MASARMEPATKAGSIPLRRCPAAQTPLAAIPRPRRGGIWYRWTTTGLANPGDTKSLPQSLRRPSQRRSEIHRRQISALHPWSLQYECSQHSVSSCRSDGPQCYCCIWPESRCVYALYGSLGETGALIHEVICDKSVVRSCAYELVHGQDAVGARLYSQQLLRTSRFA